MKKQPQSLILSIVLLILFCAACSSATPTEPVPADSTPTAAGLDIKEDEGFSHKIELPTPDPDATPPPVVLPGNADIILWLDASEGVEVDGTAITWTDKVNDTSFKLQGQRIDNAVNGKPVVRLSGDAGISFDAGLDLGAYTVFIVYQRESRQTDGPDSQRLLSVWDGSNPVDLYLPSFSFPFQHGAETSPPSLLFEEIQIGGRERFAVGQNAISGADNFHGDIAEVIIYQKTFILPEPLDDIQAYLGEKWGLEPTPLVGWTRLAPLDEGKSVTRSNHNYPLSDQDNTEGWTLFEPWSDEFDDGVLDTEKWLPHNHEWYGRHPARFLPENISEGGGTVKLAMKKDPSLPAEDLYGNGLLYENYSSATLQSLTAKRYGYFEIRARAGVGSSAFWLYAETYRDNLHNKLEIDVYEIGGRETRL